MSVTGCRSQLRLRAVGSIEVVGLIIGAFNWTTFRTNESSVAVAKLPKQIASNRTARA